MNLRPSGYEPDELPGCSTARTQPTPNDRYVKTVFAVLSIGGEASARPRVPGRFSQLFCVSARLPVLARPWRYGGRQRSHADMRAGRRRHEAEDGATTGATCASTECPARSRFRSCARRWMVWPRHGSRPLARGTRTWCGGSRRDPASDGGPCERAAHTDRWPLEISNPAGNRVQLRYFVSLVCASFGDRHR